MKTMTTLTAALICGLVLSACGGGDDGSPTATGGNTGSSGSNISTGSGNTGSSGSNTSTGSGNTGSSGSNTSTGNGGSSGSQASNYAITPSVNGTGGTISLSSAVSVQAGTIATFTLTPSSGYTVSSVGGTCGGTLSGNSYTTKAVTANCTVVATFANQSVTPTYEGQPVAADPTSFLALLNQEGAKGYRYLYDATFPHMCTDSISTTTGPSPCAPDPSPVSVFVNDGMAPSYTYELLSNPAATADFITQANTEGAKGYLYVGLYGAATNASTPVTTPGYTLYRKDGATTATYTYATDTAGPMATTAFLSQANQWGQSGYWIYGQIGGPKATAVNRPSPYITVNSTPVNLYVKNNASNSTYTYDAVATTTPTLLADPTYTYDTTITTAPTVMTNPLWIDLYSSEGAKGYRPIYQLTSNDVSELYLYAALYIKDQTQSATFTYLSSTTQPSAPTQPTDGTSFVNQLNSYGGQGYLSFYANGMTLYYFKTANCSGWLCTPSSF